MELVYYYIMPVWSIHLIFIDICNFQLFFSHWKLIRWVIAMIGFFEQTIWYHVRRLQEISSSSVLSLSRSIYYFLSNMLKPFKSYFEIVYVCLFVCLEFCILWYLLCFPHHMIHCSFELCSTEDELISVKSF
jgi:hypothetical protein